LIDLDAVTVQRDGTVMLADVSWQVRPDENWVVLGRNGSGKTTLLRVASLYLHPTRGTVRILGETWGRTDVRTLRSRIGVASQALADQLRGDLAARDVVMTGRHGALEPWWHTYTDADRAKALGELTRVGVGHLAEHRFGTLSAGERQRVQLARTLMADPALLLLDEPAAGLDLAGREDLVDRLADLAADRSAPPIVLVTHHTEEIPDGFTHAMLLASGSVVVAGPIEEVIDATTLSDAFELPLRLERRDGRWLSWSPRLGPRG
jgi:iron complex transport system ATP-binding protein